MVPAVTILPEDERRTLYTASGATIHTHIPNAPEGRDCGVMLALDRVPEQMRPRQAFDIDGEATPEPEDRSYYQYPLGFLPGLGNVQASSYLGYFQAFPDSVQTRFRQLCGRDVDENHVNDEEPRGRIVTGSVHQVYSEIAHKTRDRDGHHDTARALMTGAIGGAGLDGAMGKVHEALMNKCDQLPCDKYHEKLDRTEGFIGLRFEPTVIVNVRMIPAQFRNGSYVYLGAAGRPLLTKLISDSDIWEEIILAGCRWNQRPEVRNELKSLCVVFKPDVSILCCPSDGF
jgi:hypothetical protein